MTTIERSSRTYWNRGQSKPQPTQSEIESAKLRRLIFGQTQPVVISREQKLAQVRAALGVA